MFKGSIRNYVTVACLSLLPGISIAQSNTAITNNIERAYTLVNDVYNELNYNNTVGDARMEIKGTYYYEGAEGDPNSIREYIMTGQIKFSDAGQTLLRKDTFKRIGQDAITSFYDITAEEMNVTVANEAKSPKDGEREHYLYESLIFSPNLLLQFMLRDAASLNFITTTDKHHVIRHNNTSGDVYFLYINTETYFLERIERPMYNASTGDYFQKIEYSDYNIRDGYQAPGEIVIKNDSTMLYKVSIDLKEILPRVDYGSMRLSQMKAGDWLHVVPMDKWNSRSVIADMDDFLIVFEPPTTPEAGYTLLDNIKKAYAGKEIKYCVVSHKHADRMGGVRPFMEEGAMIVTTEGNKDFFMQIARNKHLYSKDVRMKKFISPRFMFVKNNGQDIRVKNKIVRFYLLNKSSHHSDEYLISYIPDEKILIEGDLVKTTDLRDDRKLNREEQGLVEYLDAMKINVKEVIQAYPAKGTPNVFDYDKIKPQSKLIKGSKKILEVFE